MLNIETLKAGRIYSFKYHGPVDTVVYRKQDGKRVLAPEWLSTVTITKQAAFKGNAADEGTYARLMKARNPEWQPSGKGAWFHFVAPGVVAHNKTGKQYLALVNPEEISATVFVNGFPATPEQLKDIEEWKEGKGEKPIFAVFDLEDKVECTGEVA